MQRLYVLTQELEAAWRTADLDFAERGDDTDAVAAAAVAATEQRLKDRRREQRELDAECARLAAEAAPAMEPELAGIAAWPPRRRLPELRRLAEFGRLNRERRALLDALGFRRQRAARDDAAALRAEIDELAQEVRGRRETILKSAREARNLWEEIGERPGNRDVGVFSALAAEPNMVEVSNAAISSVEASNATWLARRECAVAELSGLHEQLRSFDTEAAAEEFISGHGSLHSSDRDACKERLRELRLALRSANGPQAQLLRLYSSGGVGDAVRDAFFESLDSVPSRPAWEARVSEEVARMQGYVKSASSILAQLEELHTLVLDYARFEQNTAALGENRYKGVSVHFLEEEKFRKNFLKKFPSLRDSLIRDIEMWENNQKQVFVYLGLPLGDRLVALGGPSGSPPDPTAAGAILRLCCGEDVPAVPEPAPAARRRPSSSERNKPRSRPTSAARVRPPAPSRSSSAATVAVSPQLSPITTASPASDVARRPPQGHTPADPRRERAGRASSRGASPRPFR